MIQITRNDFDVRISEKERKQAHVLTGDETLNYRTRRASFDYCDSGENHEWLLEETERNCIFRATEHIIVSHVGVQWERDLLD